MWPFREPIETRPTEDDAVAALQCWANGGSIGRGPLAFEAGTLLRRFQPQDYDPRFSLEAARLDLELRKRFVAVCLDNWRAGRLYDPNAPAFSREALGSALVV
jgi:hypothetical protein